MQVGVDHDIVNHDAKLDTVVSPNGKQTANFSFSNSSKSKQTLNEISIFLNWRCPVQTDYDQKMQVNCNLNDPEVKTVDLQYDADVSDDRW